MRSPAMALTDDLEIHLTARSFGALPAASVGDRLQQPAQRFLLGSEGLDTTTDEPQHLVDSHQRRWTMRDDNDNSATPAHGENGLRQCRFAHLVEIGVRLVQHDEERIAVECACEGNALSLPC